MYELLFSCVTLTLESISNLYNRKKFSTRNILSVIAFLILLFCEKMTTSVTRKSTIDTLFKTRCRSLMFFSL